MVTEEKVRHVRRAAAGWVAARPELGGGRWGAEAAGSARQAIERVRPPTKDRAGRRRTRVVAPTQLRCPTIGVAGDLDLSWSEAELPERQRTKHVHRLHPYLGKFIPQLVEALLCRYVTGRPVLDPFAGSGTTLVQCLESGSTPPVSTSLPSTAC